jgi:hypothetical protein
MQPDGEGKTRMAYTMRVLGARFAPGACAMAEATGGLVGVAHKVRDWKVACAVVAFHARLCTAPRPRHNGVFGSGGARGLLLVGVECGQPAAGLSPCYPLRRASAGPGQGARAAVGPAAKPLRRRVAASSAPAGCCHKPCPPSHPPPSQDATPLVHHAMWLVRHGGQLPESHLSYLREAWEAFAALGLTATVGSGAVIRALADLDLDVGARFERERHASAPHTTEQAAEAARCFWAAALRGLDASKLPRPLADAVLGVAPPVLAAVAAPVAATPDEAYLAKKAALDADPERFSDGLRAHGTPPAAVEAAMRALDPRGFFGLAMRALAAQREIAPALRRVLAGVRGAAAGVFVALPGHEGVQAELKEFKFPSIGKGAGRLLERWARRRRGGARASFGSAADNFGPLRVEQGWHSAERLA